MFNFNVNPSATPLVLFLLIGCTQLTSTELHNRTQQTIFRNGSSSTIITRTSLREVFDFSGTQKPPFRGEDALFGVPTSPPFRGLNGLTSSTFRPTSAILYLTPPKPRHIASIASELNSIEIDRSAGLTLRWSVIVILKANTTGSSRPTRQIGTNSTNFNSDSLETETETVTLSTNTPTTVTTSTTTPSTILAKVEEERNPLKWNIYIRRYGHSHRQKYPYEDRDNTLDPPYTGNKTYHFRLDALLPESSYELCIQSVNGGRLRESAELKALYPLNAQTDLAGRNNPLFICKEVLIKPPEVEIESESEVEFITRRPNEKNQIRGRLADDSSTKIEVSEEATDAFVVYTAITSGSTTVLLLIIFVIFCCCRCNRKKEEHREYRQNILYSRAPTAGEAAPYFY